MAVTWDASASVTGTAVGSLTTASFTIGSGSNMAFNLMVGNGQTGITVSSTTCGGVSGTSSGARVISSGKSIHAWHGVNPASGSQTASVTYSDTWGTLLFLAAHTFSGVDQTNPVADLTTATGSSTTPSVTVTNAASGDYVVDAIHSDSTGNKTAGTNQTRQFHNTAFGASSIQGGADGGVMDWSLEFTGPWVQAGIRMVAAASGPSVTWVGYIG